MNKLLIRLVGAAVVAAAALNAMSLDQTLRIVVGVAVALPSLVLVIIGRVQLGSAFSVRPKATELVTTGLYAKIEHPLYLFLDLFLAGLLVALNRPVVLLAWGLLVIVHVLEARREEKILAEAFGAAYESYRARTWI